MSLELISTQDLVNELANRHGSMVLNTVTGHTDTKDEYYWFHKGTKVTCIGLCEMLVDLLHEALHAGLEEE